MAALSVLFAHSFPLYGVQLPWLLSVFDLGAFSVRVFFIVSGYLIAKSWANDENIGRYLARRALRIYPGLLMVLLVASLIMGPVVTNLPSLEYFADPILWLYIYHGFALILSWFDRLPGVFADNPFVGAINGSLWTLRYEVLMYLVIACLGWVGLRVRRLQRKYLLLAACILFIACSVALELNGVKGFDLFSRVPVLWRFEIDVVRLLGLGGYFLVGSCLFEFGRHAVFSVKVAVIATGMLALLDFFDVFAGKLVLVYVLVPYCVIGLAQNAPAAVRRSFRADYSYGIYIYAFPVQQLLAMIGLQAGWSYLLVLFLSFLLTIACAMISWHWVEKPFLALKPNSPRARPAAQDVVLN